MALLALGVLVINDHLLKQALPGELTGKLSDAAGLAYFPALLVATTERLARDRWRPAVSRDWLLLAGIAATGAIFTATKTNPAATAVYNDVLGAIQWLLTAGPLRGAEITPTAGITDPSDLLALPALGIAWRIGRRSLGVSWRQAGRRPSLLALAVLMIAGVATAATSPARRSASTEYIEDVVLTAAQPVVVRHLTLTVANRAGPVGMSMWADTYVERVEDGFVVRHAIPNAMVSLAPDPPDADISRDYHTFTVSGGSLDLSSLCREGCAHSFWVAIRLIDPALVAPGESLAATLQAHFFATGDEGAEPLDMDLSLESDPGLGFEGAPSTTVADASGSLRVSSENASAKRRFTVSVALDQLDRPLQFPLVGQIGVSGTTVDASDHPNAHATAFSFASDSVEAPAGWEIDPYVWPYGYVGVVEQPDPTWLDLFPLCQEGSRCVIDVTLESQYDASLNSPDFDPANAPPGYVDFEWALSVRLEALDGRPLPADLIVISPVEVVNP